MKYGPYFFDMKLTDMLKKIISFHTAAKGILIILTIMLLFHILVLTGIIPFEIVWGGRLRNREEMLVFESFSTGINLLIVLITAVHTGYISLRLNKRLTQIFIGLMAVLFLFNTLGNLLAIDPLEKFIFTPLTLVLALLCYRVASEKI